VCHYARHTLGSHPRTRQQDSNASDVKLTVQAFISCTLMVTQPIDFIHVVYRGSKYRHDKYTQRWEAGQDPVWEGGLEGFKFEKFKAKKSPTYSAYYDWHLDMKNDDFLKSLTRKEKEDYNKRMKEHYEVNATAEGPWYFIVHGGKCGLYQEWSRFRRVPDESYEGGAVAAFHCLKDAKNFLQYCREEEGAHWQWPDLMPIHWRRLTQAEEEKGLPDEESWVEFMSKPCVPDLESPEADAEADNEFLIHAGGHLISGRPDNLELAQVQQAVAVSRLGGRSPKLKLSAEGLSAPSSANL
jgi:hypothetical protein